MVCLPDKGLLCFVAIGLTSIASLCEFKPCYHIYWFSDFVFFYSAVKLPELLAYVNMEEEALVKLQQKLLDFLKYDFFIFKTFLIVSTYDFEYACFDTM